jgi:RIO kinase 1
MFRSLKNDALYRESRRQRDCDGSVARRKRPKSSTTNDRSRNARVSDWIEYEYETLCLVHGIGADVPVPVARVGNAVLMEFLGDAEAPAPRLCDVRIDPRDAQRLFDQILWNIELFLTCHRIHGDLSAYNVLYHDHDIRIIDFAQAVDPRHGDAARSLLERDIDRVGSYFARYGVTSDACETAARLWSDYLTGA